MSEIVGILNLTPDSFSDGGAYADADAALRRIGAMLEEGADIIDIGAESTRPSATPLSPAEEWRRLEPVLTALPEGGCVFSLDTRHAATAARALALPGAPVAWINDVSGFVDPAMVEAVQHSHCKLVVMHSLTVPADKSVVLPEAADAAAEVAAFGRERIAALESAGIARERIIFDPGIGFGKTAAQSLALIRNIKAFDALGVPVLVGHSRKSFLAAYGRDTATLALSQFLIARGVAYLRVHDVSAHKRLLALMRELHP